jgi:CDP-glucose 4,6-dehydratase
MAVTSGQALKLRYPQAVRPWQHVLDCLNGYLMIVDYLLSEDCPSSTADAWNIGPSETSFVSVAEVAKMFSTYWRGSDASAALTQPELYEANLLTLNTQKARRELGWLDRLTTEEAIFWTADWYRKVHDGGDARQLAESQIQQFLRK